MKLTGTSTSNLKEVSKMPKWPKRAAEVRAAKKELANYENLAEQFKDLQGKCEHFLEANRVCQGILGGLIPKVEDITLKSQLGVIEDVLDGANIRYTEQ
jgi:hypothetical protein